MNKLKNMFAIKRVSKEEFNDVRRLRKELLKKFRNTPPEGVLVEYLGKEFIVYPNVFYPYEDSKPLVENFTVELGDCVLDVGTGSGVIAIIAAEKGASKVVALDINPDAVRTAEENVSRHGLTNVVEVRHSDGLAALRDEEMFNVVTANLPFTNEEVEDVVDRSVYDSYFKTHEGFFNKIGRHLKKSGRLYMAQANFGNVEDMLNHADQAGFKYRIIGENDVPNDPRVFYAFELWRKDA